MKRVSSIRFDNQVVLVTGAGGGLGRAYALEFARRGAKVVVNDLGGSRSGDGASTTPADAVVDQIISAGGEAAANHDSVEHGEGIINFATERFGRIDVIINNAGILRDTSFTKMTDDDWELVRNVHLDGAYHVTRAAWPHMMEQGYGRIVFVTSAAGLYGNFGQANYSAAKAALTGLCRTLALEGGRKNVLSNVIAPVAGSRMTETVIPHEMVEALDPELIVPLVVRLCAQDCAENGSTFEAGAGWYAKVRYQRSQGIALDRQSGVTAEQLENNWDALCDFSDAEPANTMLGTFRAVERATGLDIIGAMSGGK
jgi:NAD(P)-dependent dehydrogenase (short-subunit alcohol dehydrogenase family)